MTHRFPIKEIALQSGISTATVDRVLNGRANVSPQARARVAAALDELAGQEAQIAARGRRVFVDVVVEAPRRFQAKIRQAADRVLPRLSGAVLRPRYSFAERMTGAEAAAHLDRIARRGSGGVCLKARDLPQVRAAVAGLAARRIPVVTIFTDLGAPERIAYAGLDNRAAGRTAAHLVTLATRGPGTVLTTMSDAAFAGEEARFRGFADALRERAPKLGIADASGGGGLDMDTGSRVAAALAQTGDIVAVYSMGGGNRAILAELTRRTIRPRIVIAHDLDHDNRALLAQRRIDLVLEHDLAEDMTAAFGAILHWHRLIPEPPPLRASDIRIVTPESLPAG